MKIFLIIPDLAAGGAERVVSELANNWCQIKSLDIHIVLLSDGDIFYSIDKHVTIHRLNFKANQTKVNKILTLFSLSYQLRNLIKFENPKIVLSFMNKYNIFNLISLVGLNIKIIVSERDSPTEKIPKITEILRNFTYKYADGVITQTIDSKKFIIKETQNKNVIAISNPIKKITINPLIDREKIILNTGRLVNKKGHNYLLEAFAIINPKDWRLIILGDGPLRKDLENMAKKLGIQDKVQFMGTVINVDVWLNKASIFAFPSLWEGFPNALAEAMAAGLPVVSFDCPTGPSDLIKNGENGYLIDMKDTNNFAKKLKLLIENEDLRVQLSKEAIHVASELNSEKISNLYLNFCKGA